jgi:hypothetical protein
LVSVVLDAVLQKFSVLPFIGAFPKCMIAVQRAASTSIASRDIFSVPCTSVTAWPSPSSFVLGATLWAPTGWRLDKVAIWAVLLFPPFTPMLTFLSRVLWICLDQIDPEAL